MSWKKQRPSRRAIVWNNQSKEWLSVEEQNELDKLEKIKQQLEFKKLEAEQLKTLKTDDDEPSKD